MQENSTNPPETNRVNVPSVIGAMIVSGLLRFVPFRPPNFAAIGALSLFAGARLPWYVAFFVPLMVMYFTDAILWHTFLFPPFNWYVYGSYAVTVAVGLLLQNTKVPWKILAATGGTEASSLAT